MIKFVISSDRFVQACSINEYIGVVVGNMAAQMSVLPKMLVDENDKYIVEAVIDKDGDISEIKNLLDAQKRMDVANISVARFEKLRKELTEAAKNIVNPPKGGA